MPIPCQTVGDCPIMYYCTSNFLCQHEPILPISVFTGFVYFVLLPIGVSICNVGGLASSALRMPILMGFLNFPLSQAGPFGGGIAVGASLANFILLLPKRHPVRDTALVDFLLIYIQLPPVLLGIIIGLLLSKFTPLLYRNLIMVVAFMYFCVFFFRKWRNYVPPPKNQNKGMAPLELFLSASASSKSNQQKRIIELSEIKSGQSSRLDSMSRDEVVNRPTELPDASQIEAALERQLLINRISVLRRDIEYSHSGFHWKDVGATFLIFLFFDSLLMLATGRFIQFGFCTWQFGLSISVYITLQVIYEFLLYRYVRGKMLLYRGVGYEYEVQLDNKKTYIWIILSAFFGGFFQGVAATGAGSSIVAVLLSSGYPQKVCSGTSGYLAFYFATAALIHAVLHNQLTLLEFSWFFGISFVLGGILTILLYRKIERNPEGSRVLMILISAICFICVLTVVPNTLQTITFQGWQYLLTASKAFCEYL